MDWLQLNDVITPTNPYAALFFGVLISMIISVVVWVETKQKKTAITAFIAGGATSLIGVSLLILIGFY
ncbi:hypothetical protein QGM71_14855 [Virgibacillus sp. C22-A2]|uniref:Uncharacterized protein n=1 Tax=Virgibacillus tibetensis TaxID=3042313 RepID=A0ABU6KIT6_9BACI|nr:hypothetical protein [Virgibacillus sp. C22-A2]